METLVLSSFHPVFLLHSCLASPTLTHTHTHTERYIHHECAPLYVYFSADTASAMAQRVQVAVPIHGAPVEVDHPYGKPSPYFERSVFSDYEGDAETAGSNNVSQRGARGRVPRDAMDVRDDAEAMRNPDVAAAFHAAAALKANPHMGGGVEGSPRDTTAPGSHISFDALAHRRDSRPLREEEEADVHAAEGKHRPLTPTGRGGGGSRSSSRSSSLGHSSPQTNSVASEMARRSKEVHDPDCICTLCEQRRRQAEKKRDHLSSEQACSGVAFCATM